MPKKLGAAVWGAGWVSTEHIKAWQRNPHAQVVAVGSRKEESAREKAKLGGAEGCKIYAAADPDKAYEQLLADPDVDVVSICTPADRHARETILAAQAGKHIVIEKPIALKLEDLKAMQDAVRKAKVKTVISFVLRWNPLFESIKSLLAAGALGKLFYAEVDYWHRIDDWYTGWDWVTTKEAGGSSILAGGCHAVDALRWFMGSEVKEVSAYTTQWDTRYEYPPTLVASLKFANGAVGKVSSIFECKMPYNFNIDLLGDKGTIRYNGEEHAKVWSEVLFPGQTGWTQINTILPDSGAVEHHPFQGEINHFVDCILNDVESHCNLEDAVKTHEVCIACDLSAAEGRPVQLPLIA